MKLVDIKRPKKTKKELEKEATVGYPKEDRYPYGSHLRFEKEEIEKIPALKDIKADAAVPR